MCQESAGPTIRYETDSAEPWRSRPLSLIFKGGQEQLTPTELWYRENRHFLLLASVAGRGDRAAGICCDPRW